MAIRLGQLREKSWRRITAGVEFLMRPASSIEIEHARAEVREKIRQLHAGVAVFKAIGLPVPSEAQLKDPNFLLGLTEWMIAAELAALLVDDWRGVLGDGDQPAPISKDGLADLLRIGAVMQAFEREAYALEELVRTEGKGSPLPQNGLGAEAAPTAQAAVH